jgi:hypothetical protein
MKILDIQNNGMGDVVLGCWLIHSANKAKKELYLNPRNFYSVTQIFNVPEENITRENGGNWTQLKNSGFTHELENAHNDSLNRFEYWIRSFGFDNLKPVRPNYGNNEDAEHWAKKEWDKVCTYDAPKVVLLPEATRLTRTWPMIYWQDLAEQLKKKYNCCVLALNSQVARGFNIYHFWGLDMHKLAAMLNQADLVISADSGGAHLASTLKTKVISIQGPTIGDVVFGHDEFAYPIAVDKELVSCVACNFSESKGYRDVCNNGCQALYMLNPSVIVNKVKELL